VVGLIGTALGGLASGPLRSHRLTAVSTARCRIRPLDVERYREPIYDELQTMLAVGLAAAALVVFIVVIGMGGALQAALAPWPGIAIVVMAIATFAFHEERRSLVVAGLLAASGIVGVVYGLIRIEFLTAISFPGPIFGIILAVPILGLAAAELLGPHGSDRTKDSTRFNPILTIAVASACGITWMATACAVGFDTMRIDQR
jgi:hypothetical protein